MRILITNHTLDGRAGTEMYVYDLATGLRDRGHSPIACSTKLGTVAEELRRAAIPVIDDLRACPWKPDIIHGHHHLDTMTALLALPGVPAVNVCHGWLPWEENPPKFPRIYRWIAVDHVCRDRLLIEHGLPADRVETILNFVNLERFQPRAPLPPRPKTALVFSNYAKKDRDLQKIAIACEQSGLTLQVIGRQFGGAHPHPENVLANCDIVFAKARAALESMAVGTAVILLERGRMGPMVTVAALETLRPLNFGVRTMQRRIEVDALMREIARYDPADAAEVSARVRATAGRDEAVDRWIRIYEDVVREHATRSTDADEELRQAGAYLHWLMPRFAEYHQAADAVHRMEKHCAMLEAQTSK